MKQDMETTLMEKSKSRKSDVPLGYIRTEVGVIPEDWEVKELSELGKFKKGRGINRDELVDDGYACIRYGEIYTKYNNYATTLNSRIQKNTADSSALIKKDDLLFAGSGETAEEIGKCVAYLGSNNAYAGGDIVVLRTTDSNALYLGYLLNHDLVVQQKVKYAQGDAVVHIYANSLSKIKIPLPDLTEQQAIATALSDVDQLIESLDKLIAKKRAIKQATMQQLLTGKRRLPGFKEKWEKKRLGEVLSYERPDKHIVQNNEYVEGGNIPVLTANQSFIIGYTDENFGIFKNLPVILFDDFTIDSKWVDFPFKVKSSAIKILKLQKSNVNLRYIFERMQLIDFPLGNHKRHYISEYQNVKLDIPDIDEQNAITAFLSDMDNEIKLLRFKHNKTIKIKQGMMHNLLTGRIRLI